MVQEFTVRDMTCNGCASSITAALARVPGVTAVGIDIARKNVRVEGTGQVAPQTLVAAINDAGYHSVSAASSEPSNVERWSANALTMTLSSTSSSGCGCCG